MSERMLRRLMPWLVIGVLLILWEAIFLVWNINRSLLVPPGAVFKALFDNAAVLIEFALFTLMTTAIGFVVAIASGLFLGLAIGASALIYSGLYPLLIGFNAIPKVALVPILVIWFGVGFWPGVITAWVISFFPIAVNVATGIATIEPEMRDVLRSLGASKFQILWKIGVPRAMPYLFASLKVAITLAFIGSVIAETVGGNNGIGYVMIRGSSDYRTDLVFAGLFIIAAMGIAMYGLCAWFERRMTGWAVRGSELVG
ncbi:MAG: ABC transporter permease [Reyranellaceae bacterium]